MMSPDSATTSAAGPATLLVVGVSYRSELVDHQIQCDIETILDVAASDVCCLDECQLV